MKTLRGKLLEAKPRALTEVEHRRARARLLEAAHAGVKPRSLVGLVAVFAIAGFVFLIHSRHEPVKLVAVAEPLAPKRVAPAATSAAPAIEAPQPVDQPPPPRTTHATRPKPPPAGASFDKAFSDFEQANYGAADQEFDAFAREFPSDPRAEDAAYLRAVARYKLGDREGAAALARSYLDSYPNGLRRPEATRIAQ